MSSKDDPKPHAETISDAPPTNETPLASPPSARVKEGAAQVSSTPTAAITKEITKPMETRPAGTVVQSAPDPTVNKMRRRIVWATVAGFLTTSFLMFLRFFLPRAIYEPSSVFRIGFPSDYALGVDTKWQQQYRIWVDKNLPTGCL